MSALLLEFLQMLRKYALRLRHVFGVPPLVSRLVAAEKQQRRPCWVECVQDAERMPAALDAQLSQCDVRTLMSDEYGQPSVGPCSSSRETTRSISSCTLSASSSHQVSNSSVYSTVHGFSIAANYSILPISPAMGFAAGRKSLRTPQASPSRTTYTFLFHFYLSGR